MDESSYYRVSVKVIVMDDVGRFLLAREDNNKWDMLGGGLDHGEDPTTCLRREILEETGLEVTYISPTPKYFITSQRFGHKTFVANVVYEIKLASLDFTPSAECQELKFFTPEAATHLDSYPTIPSFIAAFNPELHQ